jgi:predicted nucleotidyltransferase/DNA-binding XRE family transcriptional regulator
MTALKEKRIALGLTQQEVADKVGVSLRSYVSYENEESKVDTPKYRLFIREIEDMSRVDEEHGILTKDEIIKICKEIFIDYNIGYCYLFGSYAKEKATEKSDVDLLISSDVSGLAFYGLVEKLREGLRKKVDLLDMKQLLNNAELLNEVLKDGIKIYG